jgi:hypothetical protein
MNLDPGPPPTGLKGRTIMRKGHKVPQVSCPRDGQWIDLRPEQYLGEQELRCSPECGWRALVNFRTGMVIETDEH